METLAKSQVTWSKVWQKSCQNNDKMTGKSNHTVTDKIFLAHTLTRRDKLFKFNLLFMFLLGKSVTVVSCVSRWHILIYGTHESPQAKTGLSLVSLLLSYQKKAGLKPTKAWKCHFGDHFRGNFIRNFVRNYLRNGTSEVISYVITSEVPFRS